MKCFENEYWFWGGESLLTLLIVVVVTGILTYLFIQLIHKNKIHRLHKQSLCPNCHHPVEETFIMCPVCHYKLKTNCPSCGKVVKTDWDICPYCETELATTIKTK